MSRAPQSTYCANDDHPSRCQCHIEPPIGIDAQRWRWSSATEAAEVAR